MNIENDGIANPVEKIELSIIKWEVSDSEAQSFVWVGDWKQALAAASKLDRLEVGEDRSLLQGIAALRIVAEYGLVFHRCALPSPDSELRLLVVIDGDVVYVIPAQSGASGVFIGKHDVELHGDWVQRLTKSSLRDFSNIDAKLDGRTFFSAMLSSKSIRGIDHE